MEECKKIAEAQELMGASAERLAESLKRFQSALEKAAQDSEFDEQRREMQGRIRRGARRTSGKIV